MISVTKNTQRIRLALLNVLENDLEQTGFITVHNNRGFRLLSNNSLLTLTLVRYDEDDFMVSLSVDEFNFVFSVIDDMLKYDETLLSVIKYSLSEAVNNIYARVEHVFNRNRNEFLRK